MAGSKAVRPQRVRVLGKRYDITYLPEEQLPDVYGLCHRGEQRIDIRESLPEREEVDTVLHEILHAILYGMGVQLSEAVEEKFVLATASGLISVLQDNPQFAKWLVKPRS
ncbi:MULTISPECIES: hypothetical protein [Burkholderia]|uniref:hypothetical protein n=1 Tax=Burkholderia TaxID=32008 RepID=UPI000B7A0236|nr:MULTISPECIES: hypothetical protein [Burkholderia]MBY4728630.1 hypothetical protein [Burkholderia contaminans]MCI3969237.1 hypothetical protein [Burkholderia sp. HI4860]OXI98470.1 hypothetical protein CFB48_24025 [Burkholderia sp. AU33647]